MSSAKGLCDAYRHTHVSVNISNQQERHKGLSAVRTDTYTYKYNSDNYWRGGHEFERVQELEGAKKRGGSNVKL